jgi:hypothetical protein
MVTRIKRTDNTKKILTMIYSADRSGSVPWRISSPDRRVGME